MAKAKSEIKVKVEDEFKDEPNKCPNCGQELEDDFTMGDIYIDTDTGFITLKNKCECGVELERFYDYDRTEVTGIRRCKPKDGDD